MASVELKGLGKRYGEAVAVDGVSLHIEHGKLVCLLGPSGCGKTTTLRLVAGFIEPSAGEIVVGGKVLSSPARTVPPESRNMSMIFQSYALWPHMTVAENVAYGLKIRRLDKATIDSRLAGILATARLEALADRYPGELSGGQQQRVSLARALVVEPETLLLDEPLSNLDANLREEMRFEIRRLHDRYRYTTIYVTHDQAETRAGSSSSGRRRRSTASRARSSWRASSAAPTSCADPRSTTRASRSPALRCARPDGRCAPAVPSPFRCASTRSRSRPRRRRPRATTTCRAWSCARSFSARRATTRWLSTTRPSCA